MATPVGFIHSKDFIRNVLVGKLDFWLKILLSDRPNNTCWGMLGWMDNWEVSRGCSDLVVVVLVIVCFTEIRFGISLESLPKARLFLRATQNTTFKLITPEHYNRD